MKKSVKQIGIAIVITPILFIVGFLHPNLTVLDTTFGLAYYILEKLGLWKSGPSWMLENIILFFLCFLILPMIISFLFSIFVVITVEKVWKENYRMGIVYIIFLLTLFLGLQSSFHERISFGHYHFSNY